jgi:site-specific recombinase XerC
MTMTAGSLKVLLANTDAGPKGSRDRAILLLSFHGGLSRSELAGLNISDLRFERTGAIAMVHQPGISQRLRDKEITIQRRRKADWCPVNALEAWVTVRGAAAGALFWTFARNGKPKHNRIDGRDVTRLIQALARRADVAGDFGSSSFRVRGQATSD